ncbi:hypothetical protein HPB52_012831 [Rhipicephalus sanguineus]|uniref:Uncharacterized protein n=1 Tax=Rhipicephalus sanguineus TaxID=34632 RepID=A0A9D4PWA2_RHISA|nr:hypothetical protein HPB52_012831 [Rhipicephalus sanguineus]
MVEESAVVERSHSPPHPQPSPRSLGYGAAVVFATMTLIIVLLLLFDESPRQRLKTEPFCCPDVVNRVFGGANLSIDPCRSIFGHTCYAYVAGAREDDYRVGSPRTGPFYDSETPSADTDPVDGVPITEAGRAVAAYYRACVISAGNASPGTSSARALLNVTATPTNASLTSPTLVAVIVDLSLQYGLPSVFEFKIGGSMASRPYFNVSVAMSPNAAPQASGHSQAFVETIKADALKVVNEYLSSKISLQEVNDFLGDVEKGKLEATELYVKSLTYLTPDVTAAEWGEILRKFHVRDLDNSSVFLQVTKETFADTLKPGNRPRTLVSALVSASANLALDVFIEANGTDARSRTCRQRARELRPLLILDRIGNSPTRSQNAAIQTAYDLTARAVLAKARGGMTKDDFKELQGTLKEMTLLLPPDVVPGDLAVPTMTPEYAHAELVTRAYLIRAWLHQTFSLGISQEYLDGFHKNHVTVEGGRVIVPTSVYTVISLGQVSDPVVLMPTMGVYLADALWEYVFETSWSVESNATLKGYRDCIEKNSRSLIEWPSELLWLSVETSLEASKGPDWDALVDTAGTWNATRGQLFYMTFVHYVLCRSPHSRYPTFGIDVDVFMSAFEDFYRSFRCNTTVSKITGAICTLHL